MATTLTADRPAQWFATWFDSAHYHRLYAHRDEAEAAAFIDALIESLRPGGFASALDLGCGAGRHARQLASRGLEVTGLDLAASSIRAARQFEQPGLRFAEHDMRHPFGTGAYDYVFNLFTSFGYFETLAEHEAVIRNMSASLKPGARLVLDYLNVDHAERALRPEEIKEIDGIIYRVTRWTDARHFFKRIEIADPHEERLLEYVEQVAKFRLPDFARLFAAADLWIEHVFGDYRLRAYDAVESPRLILVARKIGAGRSELVRPPVGRFSREVLADSAQGLGRDAEIRCEHPLRHA
jgi:SAM-dependent methyltransferase